MLPTGDQYTDIIMVDEMANDLAAVCDVQVERSDFASIDDLQFDTSAKVASLVV